MPTTNKKIRNIVIAIILLCLALFVWRYLSLSSRLRVAEQAVGAQRVNEKVLSFSRLFVTNILRNEQAINFDQRLELENAVRDIKDPEIYKAWQEFTNAKEQSAVQLSFYNLFSLLLDKISP